MDIIRKIKAEGSEWESLQKSLNEIDTLSDRWRSAISRQYTSPELLQKGIAATISASLAIENISYPVEQIEKLIGQDTTLANDKKQSLVAGYNAILNDLYANPLDFPLCEDTIVSIHTALFPHGKSPQGKIPNRQLNVVNFLDSKAPSLFNRNQAVSVNNEIRDLVKWTNNELNKGIHHKLIVIAAFAYEFISIHPFREGKGELSRILSTLLLIQNGYEWAKFISIDSLFEKHRTEYYKTLKEGQQNRYSQREDITPWVRFLCDMWRQSVKALVPELPQSAGQNQERKPQSPPRATPAKEAGAPLYLNLRQKKIVAFVAKEGPVKVGDIARVFPSVSIHTIKKDMLYLRQQNLVEVHGVLKGTLYTSKQ